MAPEQALAQPTDARADLQAVGGILFRVLSGAPPFRGAALVEVLRQQIEDTAPTVTSHQRSRGLPVPPQARGRRRAARQDVFALIDFGLNSAVKAPAGSRLQSFIPAGMVSVSIGDNTWAGGTNESSYGFTFFLPGATVTVDGKPIVEKGVLKP